MLSKAAIDLSIAAIIRYEWCADAQVRGSESKRCSGRGELLNRSPNFQILLVPLLEVSPEKESGKSMEFKKHSTRCSRFSGIDNIICSRNPTPTAEPYNGTTSTL